MRVLLAISGILVSILPLIFFWVGAQTFLRPAERGLAFAMVGLTGGLLVLSVSLFFTPSVQRLQAILLGATIIAVAALLVAYRLLK